MKPIRLKIKGLNSFIESQCIDFGKLTQRGLFGIFGPTGSGKSTILDGMTLALYGETSRKSSNYININCNTLSVSFEFQISGRNIKRYRVEREFKRDNKTGSPRSKLAKIVDVTDDVEKILEEGARNVTEKCEDIIGLRLEDFTRTVVLPQGKFSEFLRLEGKDRRNMLERLFNLQEYGYELSEKLSKKIGREKDKANLIEGELKGYENINEKVLEEKKKTLCELNKNYDKCQSELADSQNEFNDGKELWNLQEELKHQVIEQEKLKKNEVYINEIQKKVLLGESAAKVKPYVDEYENTLSKIKNIEKELLILNDTMKYIKNNKNEIESKLENAKNKRNNELPNLKIKEQRVVEAIEEKSVLNILLHDKEKLEKNIAILKQDLQTNSKTIEKSEVDISRINSQIKYSENKMQVLKIPEEYKKKINEGIMILNNLESIGEQKKNAVRDMESLKSSIETEEKKSEILAKKNKEKSNLLEDNNKLLNNLIENCPGDQNSLLALQKNLTDARDKWSKYYEYEDDLRSSNTLIEKLKVELEEEKNEKGNLENEIEEIDKKVKKIEAENLAHTLRESLVEGEPCPVCGSVHHVVENVIILDSSNLKELKLDLDAKIQKSNTLSNEIVKIDTNIKVQKENTADRQKKMKELGENFKAFPLKDIESKFNNLKEAVDEFNNKKIALENKIKILNQDKNIIEIEYSKSVTRKVENSSQLQKLQESFQKIDQKCAKINNEYELLKQELGICNFKEKNEEILKKEKSRTLLENVIKNLRKDLEIEQRKKESLNEKLMTLQTQLSKNSATFVEKNKSIMEKENSIKDKACGRKDLENLKREISGNIKKIEYEYEEVEKNSKRIEKQYNECCSSIIAVQKNLVNLNERCTDDLKNLRKALSEEKVENIVEAKNNYMSKDKIEELKLKIEQYRNAIIKIIGTIENLNTKIGDRSLSEDRWIEIQNTRDKNTETLEKLKKDKIELEREVKDIDEKIGQLTKLLNKKQKLEHELSLLDDLDKLFKGKKFVEFVAQNQLKYISIEADKRLKEITCGNYGLEVDKDGRFIIRDYKNGGAQRDASTLSGGETFVTSLALALALSSQIQLKGSAPLELFFLDEGFGTLDDNLLEVVMDSLEKIHNDRLSIGIISHLESIKDRMPVKLIVAPAEAGMGGSKVKIEIN
ncbi:AAA family ATPase [Clostridium ljungdahlii]|uniref:Nuclease SbcCD subunit C n=1 Tax=Clostridium ljungdahlii TaxID=1538 RepID=A0A168LB90_9CLOT|nr:AAA family ATPase [Clostridium ljungdahlii]OAA82923.1 Nuclease SbcCD subunit C [Clostridium ljungdahlii]